MYSDVVLGFEHHHFEDILDTHKDQQGLQPRHRPRPPRTGSRWSAGTRRRSRARPAADFPQDPHAQLWGAIGAVFSSWMNARAVTYRRLHDIPESWGTAVNVQAMVFGNMGDTSATGVAFTRNPSTGESKLYGEFLVNAQGEDVVAGIRTPQDITEDARRESGSDKPSMEEAMPEAFKELTRIYTLLEKHYRDMQDMEFTVEQGKLWMLQTRNGKRTAKAALRIAVELANEGLITRKEAVSRVDPASLDQLLHPTIDPAADPRRDRHRPAGLAGRGCRRDRVLVRRGREAAGRRPQGHPGAHRDQPRGHPRHARRRGHSHHPRRHDLPRRRRRARHGQALRVRLRLDPRRLRPRHHDRSAGAPSRPATSSPSTARWARCSPAACR